MSTIAEMKSSRDAAGDRYAAAVEELKAAYVDLFALDLTLANGNVAGEQLRSFTGGNHDLPTGLRHPIYASPAAANWNTEAMKLHQEQIAALNRGS